MNHEPGILAEAGLFASGAAMLPVFDRPGKPA
jgi:hypothetical protein